MAGIGQYKIRKCETAKENEMEWLQEILATPFAILAVRLVDIWPVLEMPVPPRPPTPGPPPRLVRSYPLCYRPSTNPLLSDGSIMKLDFTSYGSLIYLITSSHSIPQPFQLQELTPYHTDQHPYLHGRIRPLHRLAREILSRAWLETLEKLSKHSAILSPSQPLFRYG